MPSIEESLLQEAVITAIMQTEKQNADVLQTLKIHIGMGLTNKSAKDKTPDIQIRIAVQLSHRTARSAWNAGRSYNGIH